MVRQHPADCDCERCDPLPDTLQLLLCITTKNKLSNAEIHIQRKKQERRVAEELRKWSENAPRVDSSQPPESQQLTRSGSSSFSTPSVETLHVTQTILDRFKNSRAFFTHLDIQIMFFWHTYQAIERLTLDPALCLLLAGVMLPFATNAEVRDRATEILQGDRHAREESRALGAKEVSRLLVADGAELRMWDSLKQGTLFIFGSSNIASSRVPPLASSESPSSSPCKPRSAEPCIQRLESVVIVQAPSSPPENTIDRLQSSSPPMDLVDHLQSTSPPPANMVDCLQSHAQRLQLEEDNRYLATRVHQIEAGQNELLEILQTMQHRMAVLEEENRRLKKRLHAAASVCAEPWSC
ncbi:hypothetical protein N7539_003514 [Penicillium diatomitis]|uniref:Uncharacterized protein n=1 Tax=Penicillium diatomitis TaxID=2819901 RepID=A0A9X0BXL7_9EURO|nr:uncharacterized protein N7539_003514 [Penicillium diatomitis]KAJ5488624.1 hypothetical protein N7539_003514 [Penicillium diatomitis]